MGFSLDDAYLDLLELNLSAKLQSSSSELTFSRQELARARALIKRVRSQFALEMRALKRGKLPVSEQDQKLLHSLLFECKAEGIAVLLRSNCPDSYTLLSQAALKNLRSCARQALWLGIPGDFMECGVWRGGACIMLRALQQALGVGRRRRTWVVDSFQGLPPPERLTDAVLHAFLAEAGAFAVSLEEVQANFARFGLLDTGVCFVKGWFADTLPGWQGQLAILRLDGDWYESTLTALTHLYDRVSWGGFIIIDDYHPVMGAYAAVNDFRDARKIQDPILSIDHQVHFWRKIPAG